MGRGPDTLLVSLWDTLYLLSEVTLAYVERWEVGAGGALATIH